MADQSKYAIHAACREGKLSTVQSLLNEAPSPSVPQAEPNLAKRKDDDGRLPIHWAASANQLDIVQLLSEQKGFDVDVQDEIGWTPLMIAASVKDSERLVEFLLNNTGQTVVHFVASKNNIDIARRLFENQPPASARIRDKRGQYALHRAAAIGSVPMVNLLIKNRSPLSATDSDGQTALHHAVAEGHGDAAVALLKAGAESDKRDLEGHLALELAPDKEVRKYIERMAENEGIEL
ncbi:hypothetical protein J7T55_008882 [Diaporthe amygdali]|uniref:uncharacterized protein n=1 Tax=Phomopsis amygdali TaxID=1214568 RepID=UPI0022FDE611|nr:uncharacterized protein J7T55_008882 [Diaporthe amygdali]KAJ0121715.1 hypothetical protein J7T55_008882 [Diaporthe amygdali]